jgi:hypothetical protein
MKTAVQVLGVLLLIGLLISCPLLEGDYSSSTDEIEEEPIINDAPGTLRISVGTGLKTTKTLQPPSEDLDIKRYEISGTLAGGGAVFSGSVNPGDTFTQYGLAPGLWTITVLAYNAEIAGTNIGEGMAEAEITAFSVTSVEITITPLDGNGTLDLTVQWDRNLLKKDALDATLIPVLTAFEPDGKLLFTVKYDPLGENWVGTFSNNEIPAGYYLLTLQLLDTGLPVWGTIEAVWILENLTTSQTYSYP